VLSNIGSVALPDCDPVYGRSGPLVERWRAPPAPTSG